MTAPQPRIVGNYALGELLGRGGTSDVYTAQHRFLGEPAAIKLLRPELAMDAGNVAAFIEEASRTREIAHPNIVRVLDVGRDDVSGSCYLVMERLAGETLARRLRRVGRLDESTVRRIAAAIADGMQAAHARGIVHRDLKPQNVMMRDDTPTILDFGIAKSLGAGSAITTSRRIGTIAYMAPEQIADGLITPAVDIWALGVIMFEAVTGRRPFDGFEDGRCPQLHQSAPRAAGLAPVSPALDALIAHCLERAPGGRPASMAALADSLRIDSDERFTQDVAALIAPAPPAERVAQHGAAPVAAAMPVYAGAPLAPARQAGRSRWHRSAVIAGGAVLCGIAVAALAMATTSSPAETKAPPAETKTPAAVPTAEADQPANTSAEADQPASAGGDEPANAGGDEPANIEVHEVSAAVNAMGAKVKQGSSKVRRTTSRRGERVRTKTTKKATNTEQRKTTSQGERLD